MTLYDYFPDKKAYDDSVNITEEQQKNIAEDEAECLKAIEMGHFPTVAYFALRLVDFKTRRDDVIRFAEMALAAPVKGNSHSMAYYALAGIRVPFGEFDEAIAILQKGRETQPADGFLCRALYHIYYHLKEYQKALDVVLLEYEDYKTHSLNDELNYDDYEFCLNIGLCYGMLTNYQVAMDYFKRALTVADIETEDQAHLHYRIGLCWQNMGDEYRARGAYKIALELSPDIPEVYNNLASLAFNEHGHVQEAIGLLEKALERITSEEGELPVTIWKNLQTMYKTIADYDKANYAHYRTICAMGMGMLFQDPSKPVDESEYDQEEDDDFEDLIGGDGPDPDESDDDDTTLESM